MTLSNKITYFILVFVKISPVKVSSLKLLVLKNSPNLKKSFQCSFFESQLLDKNSFLVAKFNFPGKGKDFISILSKNAFKTHFSNFKTLELALQIECWSSRRGKRHSPSLQSEAAPQGQAEFHVLTHDHRIAEIQHKNDTVN